MRKRMAVAVAAAFIAAGSVPAFAAEEKAPEYGVWQYQEAVETGKLPADYFGKEAERDAKQGAFAPDTTPVIEVGGQTYRVGIDTQ